MIRVGIVDDNALNRRTIREKLDPYEGIEVVCESANGEEFFEKLKSANKCDYPTIVLMDLEMPILDGISTISIASVKYPDIKFIVLTIFEDNDKIFEAIKAGASGYLLKEDRAINIVDAITNVVQYDGIPMSPAIARRAMKLLSANNKPEHEEQNNQEDYNLTDREMEILKMVVKGHSHIEIAEQLFISPNTVRTHINNLYKKLHLNSRSQVISLAYKNNWF